MNTLGLKDFSERIQKGFVETDLTLEIMRDKINDNFAKGKIDENEFCEANDIIDSFEKGRSATAAIGEIRQFGGRPYMKTVTGWEFYSGEKTKEPSQTDTSTDKSPQRKKYEEEWNSSKLRLANKYGGYNKIPRAEIIKLKEYLGDKYRNDVGEKSTKKNK